MAELNKQYTLGTFIAEGGFASVYKATHNTTQAIHAVKILKDSTEINKQRFEKEIQLLSQLNNPHIVTIYDSGTHNEQLWYSMDFIDGCNILEHVQMHGPYPPRQAVDICLQVAHALDSVHKKRIIHRDIKPSNILIEPTLQKVYLTDFGIVKQIRQNASTQSALTETGDIIGSMNYMSPEQAQGKKLTTRSDIYSLGGVLYFMLSGVPPHNTSSKLETLAKIGNENFLEIKKTCSSFPGQLEQICLKALQPQQANRYRTLKSFIKDLEAYQEGKTIVKKHSEQGFIDKHKNKFKVGVGLVCFASCLAYLGLTYHYDQLKRIEKDTEKQEKLVEQQITQLYNEQQKVKRITALLQFESTIHQGYIPPQVSNLQDTEKHMNTLLQQYTNHAHLYTIWGNLMELHAKNVQFQSEHYTMQQEAIQYYLKALKSNPEYHDAYIHYAFGLSEISGNSDSYHDILLKHSNEINYQHQILGLIQDFRTIKTSKIDSKQQTQQINDLLDNYQTQNTLDSLDCFILASLYEKNNNIDKMLHFLHLTQDNQPRHSIAWRQEARHKISDVLGSLLQNMSPINMAYQLDDAIFVGNKALSLHPYDYKTLHSLAQGYMYRALMETEGELQLSLFRKGADLFSNIKELDALSSDDLVKLHQQHALLRYQLKDYNNVINIYEQINSITPLFRYDSGTSTSDIKQVSRLVPQIASSYLELNLEDQAKQIYIQFLAYLKKAKKDHLNSSVTNKKDILKRLPLKKYFEVLENKYQQQLELLNK